MAEMETGISGDLEWGSIPALVGLIIVLPVLGHATWHLYREVLDHRPDETRLSE